MSGAARAGSGAVKLSRVYAPTLADRLLLAWELFKLAVVVLAFLTMLVLL